MGPCCNAQFSRHEWFVLVVIGSVHFASAICVSLQAPFYPEEAESKNATATEYGFVFGIYELVSFVASPLLGNFMDKLGAKFLLNSGVFLAGTSAIAFGLLDMVQNRTLFIVCSFLTRIFEAIGSSAAVTSAFAITAATFPDNIATTFAALEIFYGLGYIVGPTLGGILFALGGYKLPFIIMGGALIIDGFVIFFALPSMKRDPSQYGGNIFQMLKIPAVLVDSLSIASVSICIGFYAATLEPHIRQFMLSPVALGFVFIVSGAFYAVSAPFVGRFCDTFANPRYMILMGHVSILISVLLVGPAPFIPLEPTLPLVIVGLVFLGLGMGLVLVSAFIDAIRSSISFGFPDGIITYGLVSGLWAASFSLGDFIGPSVAGLLDDLVGFRLGSLFIMAVHILVFSLMSIFCLQQRRRAKSKPDEKEKEPLNIAADLPFTGYGSCGGAGADKTSALIFQTQTVSA